MEIKYTVEILTKDIQDIEKLVRNLNKYPTPPRIELDLALSKLRNAYDLLLMIAEDAKGSSPETKQLTPSSEPEREEPVLKVVESTPEKSHIEEPATIESQPTEKIAEPTQAETIQEQETIPPIQKPAPEPSPAPESIPEQKEQNIAAAQAPAEPEESEEQTISPPVQEPVEPKMPNKVQETPAAASNNEQSTILADRFKQDASINERIAGADQADLATKISGEPIKSIKRNIGINDRFLIIRELLNGDSESFNVFIQELDQCNNFNQAYQMMESRFAGKLEHEGVKVLVNLTKRKFIS